MPPNTRVQQPTPSVDFHDVKQEQAKEKPVKRIEHPEDLILVRNIDVDCDDVSVETVARTFSKASVNPQTGRPDEFNEQEVREQTIENDHSKSFMVRWDSRPFRIAPGQTRTFPRYIAEHYAKHLADHILQKREVAEDKTGLVKSITERPKVLKQIFVEVVNWYVDDDVLTDGEYAERRVEELNDEPALDVGEVPNTAVGKLEESDSLEVVLKKANESLADAERSGDPKKPTRAKLVAEAYELGIVISGKETKAQLEVMIRNF